jgi:metal-dependent amidase/aminoacylase/carboxypeptidase family protein
MESYVRGSNMEAIVSENKKVNRALAGAALSIGANVRVNDQPGYLPLNNHKAFNQLFYDVSKSILGEEKTDINDGWSGGSTDMGDLCLCLPVVHVSGGGGQGIPHGNDFYIKDADTACLDSTRAMSGTVCALLNDNGKELLSIKEDFKPMFDNYGDYFKYVDGLYTDTELVSYDNDSAKVKW